MQRGSLCRRTRGCSHFVPNLTIGAPVIASLRKHTTAFIDCHLMVARPEQWVEDYAKAGADQYTFHYEAAADPAALTAQIKGRGMRAGVAVKVRVGRCV